MARRRRKETKPGEEPVDESEWEDWRKLRDEIGQRLGGRATTGLSDPEVLEAARRAQERRRR